MVGKAATLPQPPWQRPGSWSPSKTAPAGRGAMMGTTERTTTHTIHQPRPVSQTHPHIQHPFTLHFLSARGVARVWNAAQPSRGSVPNGAKHEPLPPPLPHRSTCQQLEPTREVCRNLLHSTELLFQREPASQPLHSILHITPPFPVFSLGSVRLYCLYNHQS